MGTISLINTEKSPTGFRKQRKKLLTSRMHISVRQVKADSESIMYGTIDIKIKMF